MNKLFVGLAGFALALGANAEIFNVDISHADIGFSVKHMMVSNVKGSFTDFAGTVDYDIESKTLNGAEGSIKVASIDTNNEKRDGHLKTADFFNTAKFPAMTFKSTDVKKTGDNTFDVTGKLNVLGEDRDVVLPVTVNGPIDDQWGFKRIGIEGSTVLNRRDLGITNSPAAMIGDEVTVEISAEATFK